MQQTHSRYYYLFLVLLPVFAMLSHAAFEISKFWHEKVGVPEEKKSLAKILNFQMQHGTACSRCTVWVKYTLYITHAVSLHKRCFGK